MDETDCKPDKIHRYLEDETLGMSVRELLD